MQSNMTAWIMYITHFHLATSPVNKQFMWVYILPTWTLNALTQRSVYSVVNLNFRSTGTETGTLRRTNCIQRSIVALRYVIWYKQDTLIKLLTWTISSFTRAGLFGKDTNAILFGSIHRSLMDHSFNMALTNCDSVNVYYCQISINAF